MSDTPGRNGLLRVLASDKVPYVITLLIGLLGYTVKHAGDRLVSTPIVEFYCTHAKDKSPAATCTITNLSSATMLTGMHFSVIPDLSTQVTSSDIVWHAPLRPERDGLDVSRFTPKSAEYDIQHLPPGGAVDLVAGLAGGDSVKITTAANSRVRLVPSSLMTLVVKNELQAYLVLIAVWLVMIAVALWLYSLFSPPPNEAGSHAVFE